MIGKCSDNKIGTTSCRNCTLCGSKGRLLYQDLTDRLYGVPGKWNLKKCPNPQCGLIWLDPMPSEQDIGKAYENYHTHQDGNQSPKNLLLLRRLYRLVKQGYLAHKYGYNTDSLATWKKFAGILIYLHPLRRSSVDSSVMYLPANPNGRVLDVGCGSGQRPKLLQDLGWRVEGVDIDPIAVENATSKGLQVQLGTLEAQKYPDNHFDAITVSHVIEHIHQPLRLLRECNRVLKPGGRLVVLTPNGESWGHVLFRSDWRGLEPPRHLYIFSPGCLRQVVKKANFQKFAVSTTIQWNDATFLASRSIHHTGQYLIDGRYPRSARIWARTMQIAEFGILKVKPDIGEEVVLIAEK